MLSQPSISGTGEILLGILVTLAAIYDLGWRRIPNWLVLAGIIAGLGMNISTSGIGGLGRSLAGLGLGFALYFPLYLLRARGAGDVKLLAAIGSITGPGNCFWIFLLTAVLGGAIAILFVILRGRLAKTMFNVSWIIREIMQLRAPHKSSEELDVNSSRGMRLPHGALIFVGAFAFVIAVKYRISI